MAVTPNISTPGRITVSAFGTSTLSGAGTLLKLKFDVLGATSACSNLTWTNFRLNEGTPCATTTDGRACVAGGTISGTVNYGTSAAPKPVPGVVVTAAGAPPATSTTNSVGNYSLTGLGGGPYTATPTKTGDVNGISSLDAARVAQQVAGVLQPPLTSNQQLAGDASNNGSVSSFDASLIAQTVAGIPNAGIAGTWKSVPSNRIYPSLSGNQTNQNFDAILVGDVTGNWLASSTSLASGTKAALWQSNAAAAVTVSLPNTSAASGSSVSIPITVGDLTGLAVVAYDCTLTFDPNVLQLQSPATDSAGTLSSGLTITPNVSSPGRLIISAFGANALAGAGTLLNLRFNVVGAPGSSTPLTWQTFTFNEGTPSASTASGIPASVILTILNNDSSPPTTNPLDSADAQFFVRQHYLDFLNREADPSGLAYWSGQITQCGSFQSCIRNKRIDVSNAFFYELEFQQSGAYVFRLYRAAYGNNQPFPNPDNSNLTEAKKLPSYAVFVADRARVVGGANLAQAQLDLANAFVGRPEFLARYPANLTGSQFVDALLATMQSDLGVDLTSQRTALVNLFNSGGRGAVMYRLADDNVVTNPINNRAFIDAEYNRAFVATQYFGYLRRDADIGGFLFWLGQVNRFSIRNVGIQHAMVCSFVTAAEYQQRFSSVVTHGNTECPQ